MKTAIVYASTHHGNTEKLVTAISRKRPVTLINAAVQTRADLTGYDRVGFASGIDFGKFYSAVEDFLENNLPEGKPVFFLYTCAMAKPGFTDSIREKARMRNAAILGEYGCRGFNTYGPWKLVGGMNKGHPTAGETDGALAFYDSLNP